MDCIVPRIQRCLCVVPFDRLGGPLRSVRGGGGRCVGDAEDIHRSLGVNCARADDWCPVPQTGPSIRYGCLELARSNGGRELDGCADIQVVHPVRLLPAQKDVIRLMVSRLR